MSTLTKDNFKIKVVEWVNYQYDKEIHYLGLEVNGVVSWYAKVVKCEWISSNNQNFLDYYKMKSILEKIEYHNNRMYQ